MGGGDLGRNRQGLGCSCVEAVDDEEWNNWHEWMIGSVNRAAMDRPENIPIWVQRALKSPKDWLGRCCSTAMVQPCEQGVPPGRGSKMRSLVVWQLKGADPSESESCVQAQKESWGVWE